MKCYSLGQRTQQSIVQYRQRAEPLLAIDDKPRLLLIMPVQQHSTEVVCCFF